MDYNAVVLGRASDDSSVGKEQPLAATADLLVGFVCRLPWRQDTTDGRKTKCNVSGLCEDLVIGFVPRRW